MKYLFLLLLSAFFLFPPAHAQRSVETSPYEFRSGGFDGTGKWFKGREIARVMGYQGMPWLERDSREYEEKTSLLLKNMDIDSEDDIADIGAGSGYHVFKLAALAPEGVIYGIDVQDQMLNAMRSKKRWSEHQNIRVVKGSSTSTNLPENSVDKVLMVDVYHEFSHPLEMLRSIKKALRPGGRIYLVEYRGEDPKVPIKELHKMTEAQAIREFRAAGLVLEENIDNLPWQHCMVFRKP